MSSPKPGAKAGAASSPPAVEVSDLCKKFGDLEVLKGVSLKAQNGDVVAIIGGSGSGKSTLLRCINMLELPTSGEISIRGEIIEMKPDGRDGLQPANSAQLRRIRTRLAMVFQSFNLWQHMTVLGNVIEAPVQVMGVPRDEAIGEVLAVIADLAREGRTMLLVTHEMKFAREVANHVVFLAEGVIEEEGPPDIVYSAPKSERLQKFLATVE